MLTQKAQLFSLSLSHVLIWNHTDMVELEKGSVEMTMMIWYCHEWSNKPFGTIVGHSLPIHEFGLHIIAQPTKKKTWIPYCAKISTTRYNCLIYVKGRWVNLTWKSFYSPHCPIGGLGHTHETLSWLTWLELLINGLTIKRNTYSTSL